MKRKVIEPFIETALLSKRSVNPHNHVPTNSNLVLIKSSKLVKTNINKNSKNKENLIKPIANKNLKKIMDDEEKKVKAVNGLNFKNMEMRDEILEMLIKKNIDMIDLEKCMNDYKNSLALLESFPSVYQETRITSKANLMYLDEQLEKANDLINNFHIKNSNLEIMIKLREEEIKNHEDAVLHY
jgi:hypothetical protein